MKIDGLDKLRHMAASVRKYPEASQRAGYRAVNAVAAKVATQARRDIAGQVNLPQSYIADQMHTSKASPTNPVATIRMRMRAVRLARFAATQITKASPRAKGDARRGIGKGRKQAGVAVKVARQGARKTMAGAFLIPLRVGKADGGNGMGVFLRTGKDRDAIEHKYGPSPDQLFRRWRIEAAPDIKRMLAEAYAAQLRYELKGSRK